MRFSFPFLAVLAMLLLVAAPVVATKPNPEHKAGICHRTASDTNPYVFIEVDVASLDAHLNNLPGHPAKAWKSDGTFRGTSHVSGDLKNDYEATDALECEDAPVETATPTPMEEPTATPTEGPTATPTPTEEPSPTLQETPEATPTPSEYQPTSNETPTETPILSGGGTPDTAMSYANVSWLLYLGFMLIGLSSLTWMLIRRRL